MGFQQFHTEGSVILKIHYHFHNAQALIVHLFWWSKREHKFLFDSTTFVLISEMKKVSVPRSKYVCNKFASLGLIIITSVNKFPYRNCKSKIVVWVVKALKVKNKQFTWRLNVLMTDISFELVFSPCTESWCHHVSESLCYCLHKIGVINVPDFYNDTMFLISKIGIVNVPQFVSINNQGDTILPSSFPSYEETIPANESNKWVVNFFFLFLRERKKCYLKKN